MDKLLVISGQTATGKTDLGIYLARKFNGEIVSFDARQAYRHLNILTGKLHKNLKSQNAKIKSEAKNLKLIQYFQAGVSIWLYDIVDPKDYLTAYEFARLAETVVADIIGRGKLPIIVGGTVFYIKVFLQGLDAVSAAPDWRLRRQLEELTAAQLQDKLRALALNRLTVMNESDRRNKRRLIRAIEVTMSKLETQNANPKLKTADRYDTLFLALILNKEPLEKRIAARVHTRIKQGALEEVRDLFTNGYKRDDPGLATIGYQQLADYLEDKLSLEASLSRWAGAELNYAKRQLVFLRKMPAVHFINADDEDLLAKTDQLVYKWYNGAKN